MKITVNCPSYKRPKVKTLQYLPFCKVWVDCGEYDDYISANKGFEKNIISCPKGIQGNLCRIRNYILDEEFKNGADVVCIIDDDLSGIYHFEKDKDSYFGYVKYLVTADEFMDFLEKYSVMCADFGWYLWGVNLNKDNRTYRHNTPFSTTQYIGGPFSCHMRGTTIRYDERLPLKEDYDLSLQHLNKYRGILRVNKFHYDCLQSEQRGGCASYRNLIREKEQFEMLQRKWGSKIIKADKNSIKQFDYNPIMYAPIKGV